MISLYVPSETAIRHRPRVWLRLGLMLLVMALLAGGLIGFHLFKAGALTQMIANINAAQPTVSTMAATIEPWQMTMTAVGSLRASNGADLALEVGGVVDDIAFESGQDVAAGGVLLRLRLNDDEAKLQQLQATADVDATTYRRDVRELRSQGVAQSTVDTDAGDYKVAGAAVVAQQAVIDEKTLSAPFAGQLGLRQVDLGQYMAAGTTVVTLQALDPMFVDFYVPQKARGQIAVGLKVAVTLDAFPGKSFGGAVSAFNSKVDSSSRMLEVRATIANPDGALLPGMFATVTMSSGPVQSLVTIPQTTVAYDSYGSLVYVIHSSADANGQQQNIARQQFVTTGATRGDQVSILRGLTSRDSIVTSGQLKLHNNMAVKIDNSVQPTDDANPVPQDH